MEQSLYHYNTILAKCVLAARLVLRASAMAKNAACALVVASVAVEAPSSGAGSWRWFVWRIR